MARNTPVLLCLFLTLRGIVGLSSNQTTSNVSLPTTATTPAGQHSTLASPPSSPADVSVSTSTLSAPPTPAAVVGLSPSTNCILFAQDHFQHEKVHVMIDVQQLNLIEYHLVFPNSSINPLRTNMTEIFKGDSWARVRSIHGQTLLSLAFNYGILSLMTLTFGTVREDVKVEDRPFGCMNDLDEQGKIDAVLNLLMRDFRVNSRENVTLKGEERVCYEMVKDVDGYARFTDKCCRRDIITGAVECKNEFPNAWLTFLYIMLNAIRFGVLAFGPLMFLSTVGGLVREEFPYTIELKDPLIKSMILYRKDQQEDLQQANTEIKGKRKLDLRQCGSFPKLREMILNDKAPIGHPFKAKFTQYDILVSYKRLLTENKVPVGFWGNLVRSVFFCKLRQIGPFQKCCRADMLRNPTCRKCATAGCKVRGPIPWIRLWKKIGLGLLIVLLPTPYYIRLFILYKFEIQEVLERKAAAKSLNLSESFENSLIHYFLPTHPLLISVYVIYLVMAFNLAYLARRGEKGRFRRIIMGSFTDLKNLSWINVLRMMISNIIWPFQRYGLAGCLVVFVYWPIVLPLTTVVYVFYCLPTVYLTVRMFFYSKMAFLQRIRKRPVKKSYRVKHQVDDSVQYFEAWYLLGDGDNEPKSPGGPRSPGLQRQTSRTGADLKRNVSNRWSRLVRDSVIMSDELDEVTNINRDKVPKDRRSSSVASTVLSRVQGGRIRRVVEHCLASALCVAALYAVLVILSECVGCFVEVLVFTLMGIIVNASALLKYVALVVMLVVYSYDCFNNVEKKYLKLNRALFSEVKSRIKDLEKVTSLPSFLQENRGFKSQELGEQADYELSDDVSDKPSRHWLINDLVLFIDNEDMPRIPRKLFEDVCRIRVAGVPGPVYRGQLLALRQFLKIVVFIFFVFIVILSFGSVYEVSNTNQMLAALAGGSLPFILRMVMEPEKPDIEIGTVSFKNQMDEVIRNFVQYWPIYDLPFDVYTEEEEERDRQRREDEEAEKRAREAGEPRRDSSFCRMTTASTMTEFHDFHLLTSTMTSTMTSSRSELTRSNNNVDAVDLHGAAGGEDTVDGAGGDDGDGCPPKTPTGAKVCFREDSKVDEPEVDIVVYLPNKYDEIWLDEWSDYDVDEVTGERRSSHSSDSIDNGDVFPLSERPTRSSLADDRRPPAIVVSK